MVRIWARLSLQGLVPIFFVGCALVALQMISLIQLVLFCVVAFAIYAAWRFGTPNGECKIVQTSTKKRFLTQGPKVPARQLILIALVAIIAITICSASSPIYPFNTWVDANCFMTVGKSMLHGMVPYADLFEQKGPLLYMFHAFAALFSETSFIGVYLLEIVACFFFLLFMYKVMLLYKANASAFLIPLIAAVVYSAAAFGLGDSAEEFCLPFVAYTLYVGIKALRTKQYPSKVEFLIVGITAACVLCIKYTLLGLYVGWFIFVIYLAFKVGRGLRDLLGMILWLCIGVIILTLPIVIYFGVNNAIQDLMTVYFYDNLFNYSNISGGSSAVTYAKNLYAGAINFRDKNPLVLIALLIGVLMFIKKKGKADLCFLLLAAGCAFVFVYIGGKHFGYYSLILSVFIPFGILPVYQGLRRMYSPHVLSTSKPGNQASSSTWLAQEATFSEEMGTIASVCWAVVACIVSVVFAFAMCSHTYLLNYAKSDLPQYQFANIINETEDATLLNYGFLDGGFYTVANIVPTCKYFCDLNSSNEEIMEAQNAVIENGEVDYVVTREQKLDSELYQLVQTSSLSDGSSELTYRLYKLIK